MSRKGVQRFGDNAMRKINDRKRKERIGRSRRALGGNMPCLPAAGRVCGKKAGIFTLAGIWHDIDRAVGA
ncbi:hypothetical protein GCM10023069_63060 [Shinella granuli]